MWINDIQNFFASLEKIYQTYTEEPNVKTPDNGKVRKHLQGAVEFRDVSYRADDADIIHDISFKVEPGQTVGIIGTTGAGKSTIMNLLCRFYDTTEGEVLVDGLNVKDYNLYDLRDNIGMAMQDVFLFSDTIEGNIAYARPDCPFEEVRQAAIKADANHFIKNLPDGYDTIGPFRGTEAENLSGKSLVKGSGDSDFGRYHICGGYGDRKLYSEPVKETEQGMYHFYHCVQNLLHQRSGFDSCYG